MKNEYKFVKCNSKKLKYGELFMFGKSKSKTLYVVLSKKQTTHRGLDYTAYGTQTKSPKSWLRTRKHKKVLVLRFVKA